jgi:hypothetical protein
MNDSSNVTRLPTGVPGQLTTESGSQFQVRVTKEDGDALQLVLMLDQADELKRRSGQLMVLEYTSAKGLIRLSGKAVLEEHDLVRFEIQKQREVVQRRDFVRVGVAQPLRLAVGASDEMIDTFAVDVSGGGMRVSATKLLAIGDRVRFELEIGAGQPITGTGRVVRSVGEGERGIEFEQISKPDRDRLIHFIFDCQRAELARIRDGSRPNQRTS